MGRVWIGKLAWCVVAAALWASVAPLAGCEAIRAGRERAERSERAQERVHLADALREEGRLDDALAELAMAIRDNPALPDAYVRMADIHRERGDYSEAERAYGRASDLEPNNFHSVYHHALMLQLLERLAESVRVYLRALTLRPDDRDANLNLATAYLQLREPRQALPYAQRAVRVDPGYAPGRVNLGAVYSALDRHREAVLEYEAALEHAGATPEALLNMAESLNKLQRYDEMAHTLDRLVAMDPSPTIAAIAYERMGSALFRMGRHDDALAAFRIATEKDPTHYPALNGVGVCLLNKYLTSEPRDTEAQREAVRVLRRSLQINARQPRIVELLSRYG